MFDYSLYVFAVNVDSLIEVSKKIFINIFSTSKIRSTSRKAIK